jgi:HK97 family phage prohead protease
MPDIREAAAARQAAMRSTGDRPRRRSADPRERDQHVRFHADLSVREAADGAGQVDFEGYASVFEHGYRMFDMFGEYTEVIAPGAFAACLAQGPDVPLVLGHDPMRRIASTSNGTLQLSEDTTGLLTRAQLDPTDQDVQYILPKMRSTGDRPPLISEMSFRFGDMRGDWSPDFETFRVTSIDIDRGDVSIVAFGANPATSAAVRAQDLTELLRDASADELRQAERRIRLRLRDLGEQPAMTREELARLAG